MKFKKYGIRISYIVLILAFVLLFLATRFFFTGFHNTDLVFNYQNIALQMNPDLQKVNLTMNSIYGANDETSTGTIVSLSDLYMVGARQSIMGILLMFFSGICFILGILMIESDINYASTSKGVEND